MATALHLSATVRERLKEALVEEPTLVQALRQARGERLPGDPARVLYRCGLPVRRPLDPEFLEIVPVEVEMRQAGDAWEVIEVRGLPTPEP